MKQSTIRHVSVDASLRELASMSTPASHGVEEIGRAHDETRIRNVRRAIHQLREDALIEIRTTPGRTNCYELEYDTRSPVVRLPLALWDKEWLRTFSGIAFAIYLRLLLGPLAEEDDWYRTPRAGRYVAQRNLDIGVSEPVLIRGLTELHDLRVINRVRKGRTNYLVLIDADLLGTPNLATT